MIDGQLLQCIFSFLIYGHVTATFSNFFFVGLISQLSLSEPDSLVFEGAVISYKKKVEIMSSSKSEG